LADDLPFFEIDLGQLDILLPASDFCGAAGSSDYATAVDPVKGLPTIRLRNRLHPCIFLEDVFFRRFSPSIPADASESTAFLMRCGSCEPGMSALYGSDVDQGTRAFVVQRNFEMRSHPLRELRLAPRRLRPWLSGSGVVAVRFREGTRAQYVLDVKKLLPAESALAGGKT
jgi:hypothetical protein